MNDKELQELLTRASELAKAVPESLREAAFNRAVDVLLSGSGARPPKSKRTIQKAHRVQNEIGEESQKTIDYLLTHLDRTSYPAVSSASRVLDRALYLLRITRDEFDLDGLGAPDIARVLTEKFRLRATRQAVNQALDAGRTYVDKITTGGRTIYRIMNPGELYLDALDSQESSGARKKPSMEENRRGAKKPKRKGRSSKASTKRMTKSASGRPGPRVALNELVREGYFDSARRMAEIRQHIAHAKAHSYKTSDLSPTLVRMLRDNALVRNRADDGQYEYKRK